MTSFAPPSDNLIGDFTASLDPSAAALLEAALSEARRMDSSLYLVGGPVRDLLLNRPSTDIDLVAEGNVEQLVVGVIKSVGSKAVVHSRFGTATVKTNGARLDLATARRETYAHPGALPSVATSSIEEDLKRRDITINAIALGLTGRHTGQLLDPTGGLTDLSRGVVRVLHQKSFEDDATRIFRAIRYEQRLNFSLDSDTLGLLADALSEGMSSTVSADRLRRELSLILEDERPVQTLLRAGELGVLKSLYPPLRQGRWLLSFRDSPEGTEPLTFVAALAYRMSPREGQAFIARLNMPSVWAEAVTGMTELTTTLSALENPSLTPSKVYRMLDGRPVASICALMRLLGNSVAKQRVTDYMERQRFVRPLLGGADLLRMGVPQGPKVGEILHRIQDASLEGEVTTRGEEREMALRCLAEC